MNTPLNILDFGFFKPPRLPSHKVINALFEEIGLYDKLGFKRYWMAEHFSYEFAWFSPEILLPLLAGYSENIRIGWTGVLLHYHAPLLVANNFRQLSAIFHDRIDMGISGSGIAEEYKSVLLQNSTPWPELIHQTVSLTRGKWTNHQNIDINVPPFGTFPPAIWYLGVRQSSIEMTAANKMNFALSLMHPGSSFQNNVDTIKKFKDTYYNLHNELPHTTLLVSAHCTEQKRVQKLLTAKYSIDGFQNLFGSPDFITDQLVKLKQVLGNDEFTIHSPYCDRNARYESFCAIIENWRNIN